MKLSKLIISSALTFSLFSLNGCASLMAQFMGGASASGQLNYEHFVLDNGLNVYLSANRQSPRFYAQVVVNAGGKQDPADATGIAHYLEHMLFKGTTKLGTANYTQEKPLLDKINQLYEQRFKSTDPIQRKALQQEINQLSVQASQYAIPGEMDSLYSRLGSSGLNAYTSNEETVYLIDLPKNRLEQWAKIESERFKQPVFRLFQSELETVYEEKNISLDNKERALQERTFQKLYKNHPYGTQTILGSIDHLKNPSLTKMYEFYRKYYVPNNMALVISGDIDIAEAKALITRHFSSWKKRPVPKFTFKPEAPIQGVERFNVNFKGPESVLLGFRTNKYHSEDRAALTMIDMLLDNGAAGKINLNLIQPLKVRAAGSYPYILDDYGAQFLWGIPKKGQSLKEVENLLLGQLEEIKKGNFDEKNMQGIVLSYEIDLKGKLENNSSRGGIFRDAFLQQESVRDVVNFPRKLKRLSKADVVRVANKYFGKNYVAGYRHDKQQKIPKISKPKMEKMKLNPNQRSPFAKSVEATPTQPIQPRWVNYEKDLSVKSYAPGVLFYHVPNPVNDLFNLSISYKYGGKHYPNFCYIMNELGSAGTETMTAEQVKQKFFEMGINSSFNCGNYSFSINLNGLDSQLENGLALAEKVLWNAKLDPKRFKTKIQNMIKNREDDLKDVNTLRRALSSYLRFDKDSSFLDRPTNAELQKLSVADYPKMKEQLRKQNFKIHYSGHLSQGEVENIIRRHHQPKTIKVPLLKAFEEPTYKLMKRHNKPIKIYFLHHDSVQAHINLIQPGPPVTPKEAIMTRLLNEYYDGDMSAIMFQEVRESRALAYSTWAGYYQGDRLGDDDQMLGYIGTQADKTTEALKLFIQLIRTPPVSDSHFDRSKKSLNNSFRTSYIKFRSIISSIQAWGKLGYDKDPRPERFEMLKQVKLPELIDFIKERVSKNSLTFSIVGDRNRIDLNALKQLGEFEEIKKEQLFTK